MSAEGKKSSSWALASSQELLPRKTSTNTLLGILDEILYAMGRRLFYDTSLFKKVFISYTVDYSTDKRRRMSSLEADLNTNTLIRAVIENKFEEIISARVDRNIMLSIIYDCYEIMRPILDIEMALCENSQNVELMFDRQILAKKCGADVDSLFGIANFIKNMIALYRDYNSRIISRYYRLAYHRSLKTVFVNPGRNISQEDLYKSLIMGIGRAVDKCDQFQGTLTSYVKKWFVNVEHNPEFIHEFGTSYDVPYAMRKVYEGYGISLNNFYSTMEAAEEIPDDDYGIKEYALMDLMRYIPKAEIAFVLLGFKVNLTPEEVAILKESQNLGR